MVRIAFLGPEGTFTEQAARVLAGGAELVGVETIPAAFDAVRSGAVEGACVPVENSVEGPVTTTLDSAVDGDPLVAVAEALLPIRFSVLVAADRDPVASPPRTVASHPHALAQVRGWLDEHLPDAEQIVASSTAGAAVGVLEGQYDAAVVAPIAAEHYPLKAFATDVADLAEARTRFLLLRTPGTLPEPTGADRTSIVVAAANRTGSLAGLLTELAMRGINLTRLDARPVKGDYGTYRFFFDFEGHIAEPRIADALAALRRRSMSVRFLGSHPRADGVAATIEQGEGNDDFVAADAWVEAVRKGEIA